MNGTQRIWSGSGRTLMTNVTVQDQGGTLGITVYSGTNTSGNENNWAFLSACPPNVPGVVPNVKMKGGVKVKGGVKAK